MRTAIWPRRKVVSSGSLTNKATDDEQNLAAENAVGFSSRSNMKRVRRTSGAERVRTGWMRECSTVGKTRIGGQM